MKEKAQLFQEVMTKYKLDEPIPDDIQAYILQVKKKNIVKILKKVGAYSFSLGLLLSAFFSLKKIGITLSLAKSALVLFVSTIVAATSISAGLYFSIQYVKERREEIRKLKDEIKASQNRESKIKNPVPVYYFPLAIRTFKSSNVDSKILRSASEILYQEIISKKGKRKILFLGMQRGKYKRYVLGRIEKIENIYFISVKVIDVKTKEVLFSTSEAAESQEDISDVMQKVAQKIVNEIDFSGK